MTDQLPNDSDGDALRRLIATGSDLRKEMEIDFAVLVPNPQQGRAFAAVVAPLGFRTDVEKGGDRAVDVLLFSDDGTHVRRNRRNSENA